MFRSIALGLIFSVISLYADNIYATFDVKAEKSADLAFSTGGIIKEMKVDIGSLVKKDDILASLENEDVKALLQTYKTTLKYAKLDFDRQKKVKNIIDKAQFDSFEYKYENAKNQVAYQKALLSKTHLRASFDGIITSKELEVGDVVSGQMIKTVFSIQSPILRKLVIKFDQKYFQDVKVGDIFKYKIDGDEKEYEGTIFKIYPTIDDTNRKVVAEVKAKNFPVGLFGDGYILTK